MAVEPLIPVAYDADITVTATPGSASLQKMHSSCCVGRYNNRRRHPVPIVGRFHAIGLVVGIVSF